MKLLPIYTSITELNLTQSCYIKYSASDFQWAKEEQGGGGCARAKEPFASPKAGSVTAWPSRTDQNSFRTVLPAVKIPQVLGIEDYHCIPVYILFPRRSPYTRRMETLEDSFMWDNPPFAKSTGLKVIFGLRDHHYAALND